ncbi:MAG: O-antigen ligase [Nostocaceae cyanobacterium]|nr:O-antigen ligase [Nostocaceae cyanobacterium]
MIKIPERAEKIFATGSIFFFTGALIPVLMDNGTTIVQDPFSPVIFMGIYAVSLVLLISQWQNSLRVAIGDIFTWILIGIVIASVSWTIMPDITPRRVLLMAGTNLFALYFATRYSLKEQLKILAWAFGIIIVLSFVFAIALPFYGVMSYQEFGAHAGAWRGIMSHKNMLGRLMDLSVVAFLLYALDNDIQNPKYRWLPWAGYTLSIVLILLSTSKTALVVWLTLSLLFPLFRSLRYQYTVLVPFLITIILLGSSLGIFLVDNAEGIAKALGKDLTLTGRSDIWIVMMDKIWERPWFGYGFNAFWQGWDSPASAYMWRTLQWECPYAHNGVMDLLAELGFCALILFLCSYFMAWVRGIGLVRITRTPDGIWPVMYLTFLFMSNITESTLLATNSIFWILFVSVCLSIPVEYKYTQRLMRAKRLMNEPGFSDHLLDY